MQYLPRTNQAVTSKGSPKNSNLRLLISLKTDKVNTTNILNSLIKSKSLKCPYKL